MRKTRYSIFIFWVLSLLGITFSSIHAQMLTTVVAVTGNIFDAVTKEPQTVFVIVKDDQGNKVTATRSNAFENGYYYFTGLRPGKKYIITLKKA